MKSLPGYLLAGLGLLIIQSTVLPQFLPWHVKPDLLLILVIHLGFKESRLRAGVTCYLLGLMQDVFAGESLGLYGLVFLVVFLAIKSASSRLNAESPALLLFMVACGTLLEAFLLIFFLGFFAEAGHSWRIIVGSLPLQIVFNLAAAGILLKLFTVPRRGKPAAFSFALPRLR